LAQNDDAMSWLDRRTAAMVSEIRFVCCDARMPLNGEEMRAIDSSGEKRSRARHRRRTSKRPTPSEFIRSAIGTVIAERMDSLGFTADAT
jgi:hypothetical protein